MTNQVLTDEEYVEILKLGTQGSIQAGRAIESAVLAKLRQEGEPSADEIMNKVQEFASTWAVVDGRFDDGTALERAEECKEEIRALLSRYAAPQPSAEEIPLHIIRQWPDGFAERLQAVWLDTVSFIPNVKLYDLQRVLAEFGFTMTVTESNPAEVKP